MYAFIDRHPHELGNAGRFMLWAMRGWAQSAARKTCPSAALYRGFVGLGLAPALTDFNVAMTLLQRDALQPRKMAVMGCCRIHEHEAVMLALWQAIGCEDGSVARGTLEHLVKTDSVKPIARAMAACSTHLVLAGFDLSEAHVAPIGR